MELRTIAELEQALIQFEAENALGAISNADYRNAKKYLEDAIIDKQLGPLKRRIGRELGEYFPSLKIAKSERASIPTRLKYTRTEAGLKQLYREWQGIYAFRKIALLPEYDVLLAEVKAQMAKMDKAA
jgi:hypothetical protein